MNHSEPLPGCSSLEEAEELYRLDAMQMQLRERRATTHDRVPSIKEVEDHCDGLRARDSDVYITYLYVKSRLAVVFSDLSDGQLRRAASAVDHAVDQLHHDKEISEAVRTYMWKGQVPEEVLDQVRERIDALLPTMLSEVTRLGSQGVSAHRQRRYGVDGLRHISIPSQETLPAPYAEAALRLRIMMYLRHPVDLIREISLSKRVSCI